jgi:transposase InsO family protein
MGVDHPRMVINMDESRLSHDCADRGISGRKRAGCVYGPRRRHRALRAHQPGAQRFDYPRRSKRRAWRAAGLPAPHQRLQPLPAHPAGAPMAGQPPGPGAAGQALCGPCGPFPRKYTPGDVELLVEMDRANEDVCGPAIVHLLSGPTASMAMCAMSAWPRCRSSHLYNLRKSAGYQAQRVRFTKTRPVCNPIGVRKAPRPHGRAGFVRIDTVHQGDLDGIKGVYHITCVDSGESVAGAGLRAGHQRGISCCPYWLLVIAQFPFEIEGFHSDNGSEYVNGKVAAMLEKLRIEQTKSRSRHSNDNALAESKNASVVRKHMGYSHIPQKYAQPINTFYQEVQPVAQFAPPVHVRHRDSSAQRARSSSATATGREDPAGMPGAAQCEGAGSLQGGDHAAGSAGPSRHPNRPGAAQAMQQGQD